MCVVVIDHTSLRARSRGRANQLPLIPRARSRGCKHLTAPGGKTDPPRRHSSGNLPDGSRSCASPPSGMAEEMSVSGDQTVDGGPLGDFRQLTRLYCRNGGHHLQIVADGTVRGQRDEGDVHSKTALTSSRPLRGGCVYMCMWGVYMRKHPSSVQQEE